MEIRKLAKTGTKSTNYNIDKYKKKNPPRFAHTVYRVTCLFTFGERTVAEDEPFSPGERVVLNSSPDLPEGRVLFCVKDKSTKICSNKLSRV